MYVNLITLGIFEQIWTNTLSFWIGQNVLCDRQIIFSLGQNVFSKGKKVVDEKDPFISAVLVKNVF